MRGFVSTLRLIAAAIAALSLAACAQPRDSADVGIGTAAYVHKQGKPYAALFKPYAYMSALAYSNGDPDPKKDFLLANKCPSQDAFDRASRVKDEDQRDNKNMAKWLRALTAGGWYCSKGYVGPYGKCVADGNCIGGFQFHIWMRNGPCGEAVIAFRGTDFMETGPFLSRGDLISNLHWIISLPIADQYAQARDVAHEEVDELLRGCPTRLIVSTGHSLGGGLAQRAAFERGDRIRYVYAFDPSPVTGLFDIAWPLRQENTARLGVDRIFQAGEILSLPRYLASGVFATSPCQPRIRVVRFATVDEPGLVNRHRIRNMATGLDKVAPGPLKHAGGLPYGFANAARCDFTGNDPEQYSDYPRRD